MRGGVTCGLRCAHAAILKVYNTMQYGPSHTFKKTYLPSRVYAGEYHHVFQQSSDIFHCIIRLKENDMVISKKKMKRQNVLARLQKAETHEKVTNSVQ